MFFTLLKRDLAGWLAVIALGLLATGVLSAATTDTNSTLPSPGEMALPTNTVSEPVPPPTPEPAPAPVLTAAAPLPASNPLAEAERLPAPELAVVAALVGFGSLLGFLLYYSGQVRAKNSSHTSMLLLLGLVFALVGYWAGGFAVQTGGIGDAHAALSEPLAADSRAALDHEMGWTISGHYWGLMGSAGFFLATPEDAPANDVALLFLLQTSLMIITVAGALGAGLERGRLMAYAVAAFLIGAVIYPFEANWTWGGGWLAELGHNYGLGHGFIDFSGAAVIHESAGTLALVIALLLGPRLGRFSGGARSPLPGHHVPYIVGGAILLLASWVASSALLGDPSGHDGARAAVNTLLGAAGGLLTSVFAAGWQRRRPEPALICRGLLGGAIATLSGGILFEPWAAFEIGAIGALVVLAALRLLERLRIDDPSGAAAVHGAGGAWGVIATGLLANGAIGDGLNGVSGSIRGAIYSGQWQQITAQVTGAVACFVAVFILGYAFLGLVHKILHSRVDAAEEAEGLDWTETGAFGYQPDVDPFPAAASLAPTPVSVELPKGPEKIDPAKTDENLA